MAKYDEILAVEMRNSQIPLWERGEGDAAWRIVDKLVASPLGRARYAPIAIMFPEISMTMHKPRHAAMMRDGLNVAIAAELYKRHTGNYPATLSDLPTTYLPSIPMDIFDGRAIRYKIRDGKPLIYSVSSDHIDDGGVPPAWPGGNEAAGGYTALRGDWVLYPPARVATPGE